MKRFLGKSIVS